VPGVEIVGVVYVALVAPEIEEKPAVALVVDCCQVQVMPGLVVEPTLNILAENGEHPSAGPAFAIPASGVPEQGGAPPLI
jgi:hypothetical protein